MCKMFSYLPLGKNPTKVVRTTNRVTPVMANVSLQQKHFLSKSNSLIVALVITGTVDYRPKGPNSSKVRSYRMWETLHPSPFPSFIWGINGPYPRQKQLALSLN